MQRVGIVGAGGMGNTHAGAYGEMPSAQVVAVADIRPEAAHSLAEQHNAKAFTNVYDMLAGAELDVVDVCTPTPWHAECIIAAAKARKHVSTEKPLARTMDQCREAIKACEDAGVTLFVAQVLRAFPEFVQMRDMVRSGSVGRPAMIRTSRGGVHPRAWQDWFANYEWSGGVALDTLVHDFDWILWTFGPAERVFAKGLVHSGHKVLDYALVTIRLASGAIVHAEGTWAMPSGFSYKVEVAGDKGLIRFDSTESVPLVIRRKAGEGPAVGVPVPESPLAYSPFYLELKHFIDCVEAGKRPDIAPQEAMAATEIGLAAIESIKTGKPVAVSGGAA